MLNKSAKVAIIGTGLVGSTTAYALMLSGLVSELVLIDKNVEKAEGEAMDLSHGLSFVRPVDIKSGSYEDCKDADIVIITAGISIISGGTRLDIFKANKEVSKSIAKSLQPYLNDDTIIIIVSNPVDLLTHIFINELDHPMEKIIGSGTVLDSARFRYLLSEYCEVDIRNVHAYVLGEHGDSEVLTWSVANIGTMDIGSFLKIHQKDYSDAWKASIEHQVKNAGYEVFERKKATYYAVALAVRRIAEAVLRNEKSILTVANTLMGSFGIEGIALSVPCIVDREGIRKIVPLKLSDEELGLLHESAGKLKEVLQ